MFRDLIPLLSDRFHLLAPDLPGFGQSEAPRRNTFDHLAEVIEAVTEAEGFDRFALYVFDYGAPVGLRLGLRHPERIRGIITQNGNAYVEGLSEAWAPLHAYWAEPTLAHREALRPMLSEEVTRWQYLHGVPEPERVSPDGMTLDMHYLSRPGAGEVQLDLMADYRSNLALYPAFQAWFRDRQPPLLAVWGRHDPFFLPQGAEAFARDIPAAKVVLLDTGHFALETHAAEIASEIRAMSLA